MNDCTTCKFERPLMYCLQGHVRKIKYSKGSIGDTPSGLSVLGHEPIENCHGWEEKEQYLCEKILSHSHFLALGYKFCPECGNKLI